jgi:uncharacterized membrane protein HdeD (DUF308 family)
VLDVAEETKQEEASEQLPPVFLDEQEVERQMAQPMTKKLSTVFLYSSGFAVILAGLNMIYPIVTSTDIFIIYFGLFNLLTVITLEQQRTK